MNKQELPKIQLTVDNTVKCELSPAAAKAFVPFNLKPLNQSKHRLEMMDVIGMDFWGEGITAENTGRFLKEADGEDVTVVINSPGGSFFEGLAIYNLLRQYEGKVTIEIVGLAASVASLIAMAGDDIRIAQSGFLMIHNTLVCVCGHKSDLREAADAQEKFDNILAEVYASRSTYKKEEIVENMQSDWWLNGQEAVDANLVDDFLEADLAIENRAQVGTETALRRIDAYLASSDVSRTERRTLVRELKDSMNDSAVGGMNDSAAQSLAKIKNFLITGS